MANWLRSVGTCHEPENAEAILHPPHPLTLNPSTSLYLHLPSDTNIITVCQLVCSPVWEPACNVGEAAESHCASGSDLYRLEQEEDEGRKWEKPMRTARRKMEGSARGRLTKKSKLQEGKKNCLNQLNYPWAEIQLENRFNIKLQSPHTINYLLMTPIWPEQLPHTHSHAHRHTHRERESEIKMMSH